MKYHVIERQVEFDHSVFTAHQDLSLFEAAALYGQRMILCVEIWMIDEQGTVLYHSTSSDKHGYAPVHVLTQVNLKLETYVYTLQDTVTPVFMTEGGGQSRKAEDAEIFRSRDYAITMAGRWADNNGYDKMNLYVVTDAVALTPVEA